MCLFAAVFQVNQNCPLFVLANRDESRSRPTEPPQVHRTRARSAWIGGTDVRAGGTWLGVNEAGLLVAVTNRAKSNLPENVRSRGILCRELLEQPSLDAARKEFEREWRDHEFAGFNLLMFSGEEAIVLEAGDELRISSLKPGVHTIANRGLNEVGDPRVIRAQRLVEDMVVKTSKVDSWIAESQRILGLHEQGREPGLCHHRSVEWGTVCSTIVALTRQPAESKYFYAAGPPCETSFMEYSSQFASLITSPQRP